MKDDLTRAGVSLHGVLRNMEDLCQLDSSARDLISSTALAVRFDVPGLEALTLNFLHGQCRAFTGSQGHRDIHLRFLSPTHFLAMMEGKSQPIPTKGLSKIGFMTGEFSTLAKLLENYLLADGASLEDPHFRRINTILSAYIAFFGLSQVANLSPVGKILASGIEDGDMDIDVIGGPGIHLRFQGGKSKTIKGLSPSPKARMVFKDLKTAGAILLGERDSFAAIGCGELAIWGRVPMIDQLNKLLGLLPVYLS